MAIGKTAGTFGHLLITESAYYLPTAELSVPDDPDTEIIVESSSRGLCGLFPREGQGSRLRWWWDRATVD